MTVLSVKIEPVDPVLFKDNRCARAEEDHVIASHGPSPFTVFGAVGARIARKCGVAPDYTDWEKAEGVLGLFNDGSIGDNAKSAQLLGFAYCDGNGDAYYPSPLFFRIVEERKGRYYPVGKFRIGKPPGCSSSPYPEYLSYGTADSENEVETPFFVKGDLLEDLLTGREMEDDVLDGVRLLGDFRLEENRAGLGMDSAKNIARKKILFNRPYWRFRTDFSFNTKKLVSCGIKAWFLVLEKPAALNKWDGIGFLGGDRGRARFEFSMSENSPDLPLSDLRKRVENAAAGSKGFFLYFLTPCPALESRVSFDVRNREPVAAVTGKPLYLSGWTTCGTRQQPRPMLHCIPPGSVLFYRWPNDDLIERKKTIADHWFASMDQTRKAFGFGRTLAGVWS